jgi:hypothetical protein
MSQHTLTENQLHSEYFSALHRITVGLMRRKDLDSLLKEIVVRAADLLGTPNAFLYMLTDDGAAMEMKLGMGFHRSEVGARRLPGEGFVGASGSPGSLRREREWPGLEGAKKASPERSSACPSATTARSSAFSVSTS